MFRRYVTSATLVVAIVGFAGMLTACGSPPNSGRHQEHQRAVRQRAELRRLGRLPGLDRSGSLQGRGVGTAFIGPVDNAVGTAAECSRGVIVNQVQGYHAANTDEFADCDNNKYLAGKSWFDVHGTGTYTVDDGSVLYLVYHEHSESPFQARMGRPFARRRSRCTTAGSGMSTRTSRRASSTAPRDRGRSSRRCRSGSTTRPPSSRPTRDRSSPSTARARRPTPQEVACDKPMSGPITGLCHRGERRDLFVRGRIRQRRRDRRQGRHFAYAELDRERRRRLQRVRRPRASEPLRRQRMRPAAVPSTSRTPPRSGISRSTVRRMAPRS